MILHAGGKIVTRDQVAAVQVPEGTKTWHPRSHISILSKIEELLDLAGYDIASQQLALSHNGNRFFAFIDLKCEILKGVTMSLALRNSLDKSFPYGLAGGTRTFVCDNLALSGNWDALTIRRKHTVNGEKNFVQALATGIAQLEHFRNAEADRLSFFRTTDLPIYEADGWMIELFNRGIISPRALPEVIRQWRDPQFEWGYVGTLYHLYQAVTTPLQSLAKTNRFS